MWKTQSEYFEELHRNSVFVLISVLHANKIYKGYIRAVNNDGVFVSSEMGDGQRATIEDVVYIPHGAISSVERGL